MVTARVMGVQKKYSLGIIEMELINLVLYRGLAGSLTQLRVLSLVFNYFTGPSFF